MMLVCRCYVVVHSGGLSADTGHVLRQRRLKQVQPDRSWCVGNLQWFRGCVQRSGARIWVCCILWHNGVFPSPGGCHLYLPPTDRVSNGLKDEWNDLMFHVGLGRIIQFRMKERHYVTSCHCFTHLNDVTLPTDSNIMIVLHWCVLLDVCCFVWMCRVRSSNNAKKIIRNPQELDNSYSAYEEEAPNKSQV